ECLMRGPSDTNIEPADILFEYARRKRAESAVDRACIAVALKAAQQLDTVPRFFLNVHASTLGRDADFVRFYRRFGSRSFDRSPPPDPGNSREAALLERTEIHEDSRPLASAGNQDRAG